MTTQTPIPTRPPSPADERLRERFDEEVVKQAERLDDIAKLLLTVNLTISGFYVTALKLLSLDEAATMCNHCTWLTFLPWLVALVATLIALLPRRYPVDTAIIRRSPTEEFKQPFSIEAYFKVAARYKYRWVVAACCCFVLGLAMALYSLL